LSRIANPEDAAMAHDTAPLSNAQMRDIEALLHP